jgi:hypothetical protein
MDLTLIFVGAVVSVIVQLVKKYWKTDRLGSLIIVLVLSLIGGYGSWYLKHEGLWESVVQIVGSCAAVYAFVIKNIEIALDKE